MSSINYDLAIDTVSEEIDALFEKNHKLLHQATTEESFEEAERRFDEAIVNAEMAGALITLKRKYIIKKARYEWAKRMKMFFVRKKAELF